MARFARASEYSSTVEVQVCQRGDSPPLQQAGLLKPAPAANFTEGTLMKLHPMRHSSKHHTYRRGVIMSRTRPRHLTRDRKRAQVALRAGPTRVAASIRISISVTTSTHAELTQQGTTRPSSYPSTGPGLRRLGFASPGTHNFGSQQPPKRTTCTPPI